MWPSPGAICPLPPLNVIIVKNESSSSIASWNVTPSLSRATKM